MPRHREVYRCPKEELRGLRKANLHSTSSQKMRSGLKGIQICPEAGPNLIKLLGAYLGA